ncbi:MAG: OsmC family protein [Opitutales bacterium]
MITTHNINGVDTEKLTATIDAIREAPDLARCEFRVHNNWVEGGHNQIHINEYHAAGQDSSREMPFEVPADEPPALLGHDRGPNPVEHLLGALSACMTTSMVYHAAAHGVKIDELDSDFSGDLDMQGFLGLKEGVRPGYQEIRAKFHVRSDAPAEELASYVKYSPVYDVVSKSVPISVEVEKK